MEKKNRYRSLYLKLTLAFVVTFVVVLLSFLIYFIIANKDLITKYNLVDIVDRLENKEIISAFRSSALFCLVVGCTMIFFVAMNIIKPVEEIKEATKKIASGDLSVKVYLKRKDEIGDLAKNFNVMVDELNSIEYLRKDFISNVSHEFKTPVASIEGFAKLLQDDSISKEEKDEYLGIIIEETERLSKLSSNMIMLSQVENQEIVKNRREFRLDEQIRKVLIMLEEKISEKNIKINFEAGEVTILENYDLSMEIWINLLNNAVKYTNDGGTITINITENSSNVLVSIKDNGIGIPDEKQDRIFEKFYQAESSHSSEGSGLGLAIVKRIVELLDGKIKVESKLNVGTTFFVTLKKVHN